ncbi:Protein dead ringer [Portunus trituberculatus]|uniref:Protein dead ringer n=1 Tax=Portunus trituberculatus TaxID=210409 RepID=A0A5B7GQ51_PORTR|nr:Protein dead ringer [Portunus trituberculatus]
MGGSGAQKQLSWVRSGRLTGVTSGATLQPPAHPLRRKILGVYRLCFILTWCFCAWFQLYELDDDVKRKDFLDELFSFMQKRGEYWQSSKVTLLQNFLIILDTSLDFLLETGTFIGTFYLSLFVLSFLVYLLSLLRHGGRAG